MLFQLSRNIMMIRSLPLSTWTLTQLFVLKLMALVTWKFAELMCAYKKLYYMFICTCIHINMYFDVMCIISTTKFHSLSNERSHHWFWRSLSPLKKTPMYAHQVESVQRERHSCCFQHQKNSSEASIYDLTKDLANMRNKLNECGECSESCHFSFPMMGVSKNATKWMVYNGKTLLKWMIWWYPPLFLETPRWGMVVTFKKCTRHQNPKIQKLLLSPTPKAPRHLLSKWRFFFIKSTRWSLENTFLFNCCSKLWQK